MELSPANARPLRGSFSEPASTNAVSLSRLKHDALIELLHFCFCLFMALTTFVLWTNKRAE